MNRLILYMLLIQSLVFPSVSTYSQLIKNQETLNHIQKQLAIQKKLAKARSAELFSAVKTAAGKDEKQALDFLYAYMPLSDLADYSREFFLENVKMSLRARNEMSWGKNIPEEIFLHFVLPLRVNNENLDSFRILMYDEIKNRIKGLSMKDAVLELNHWCHEKVTYKGSDSRTSSPLSTMRYTFGRCGEESTFTVNTLRTAGIPARQVYTPRWAHTDDNHAWVEAWVDGKWYFLGACEPAPDLNMGWFAAPSTRAMLMNTRAYGWYNGSEPNLNKEARFSELNLIQNYAPSKSLFVKVLDSLGKTVNGAEVEFQLYNYAEFYPLSKQKTDKYGLASMITGFGDLMIWASFKNHFGYRKITVENSDTITIILSNQLKNNVFEEFDLIPPLEREVKTIGHDGQELNNRRLKTEDSIRTAFMHLTFKDTAWAENFARENKTNSDSTINYIIRSYGNWPEIAKFIGQTTQNDKSFALKILSVISDKDLRDTKAFILNDHLKGALKYRQKYIDNPLIWEQYVLSGRIENEMMIDWRNFLFENLKIKEIENKAVAESIKKWIETSIKIDNVANLHSRAPLSPAGVFKLKVADSKSRDIFFVAACRTFGIAARLQPETLIPQYWDGKSWQDIIFGKKDNQEIKKGKLVLINKSSFDPKYYIHFTLALFNDGVYRSLQFPEEKPLSELNGELEVPSGHYMLVTGNRRQDGSVLCRLDYFELKQGEKKEINIVVRDVPKLEASWAQINTSEYEMKDFVSGKKIKLSEITPNKPFVLAYIEPDREPTKHLMADLQPIKGNIEKWGGAVIFILLPSKTSEDFKPAMFSGLPSQSKFVWDENGNLLKKISEIKNTDVSENLPVIISSDESGNLQYFSKGYKIGIGEQLVKYIIVQPDSQCRPPKQ
ncbi:MAG: transglutaminase-like domain-containing protein [Bacteroidales bacterium]